MKVVTLAMATLFAQADNWDRGWGAGSANVRRIVDDQYGIVCYVAMNANPSSHTTPSMQCLRFGPATLK